MAQLRQPRVAGVAGGVGTTTIARALAALDCDRYEAGEPVDVLVARATLYSLGCAQQVLASTPRAPVLAVVGELPGSAPTAPTRARLRMTEPELAGFVFVPYVPDWVDDVRPHDAAIASRAAPDPRALSRPVRAFVTAIQELIGLVSPLVRADPIPDYPSSADFLPDEHVPHSTFLDPHLRPRKKPPGPTLELDEDDLPSLPKFMPHRNRSR
jgi:hypothetical protein